MPVSFDDATAVKQLDSHRYEVTLQDDWCIGTVPHGGYVTSCFLRVANAHFMSTLRGQNQPHAMTLHMEFPRRTEIGLAKFTVKDVKLGRQTSTVHIALNQKGHDEVLGYFTMSNLDKEDGISLATEWYLMPTPPRIDFRKLRLGTEPNWAEQKSMPFTSFRKASNRVRFFFPRQGQPKKSITDQWVCFRNGDRFTTESLGFVADMFPQVVEGFREDGNPYELVQGQEKEVNESYREYARYWYPTVVLNLDVKKALPKEGVEWLFCRISSKQIKKGRFDIEVVIRDDTDELVALSHHVTLVLSAARNISARNRDKTGSKM